MVTMTSRDHIHKLYTYGPSFHPSLSFKENCFMKARITKCIKGKIASLNKRVYKCGRRQVPVHTLMGLVTF